MKLKRFFLFAGIIVLASMLSGCFLFEGSVSFVNDIDPGYVITSLEYYSYDDDGIWDEQSVYIPYGESYEISGMAMGEYYLYFSGTDSVNNPTFAGDIDFYATMMDTQTFWIDDWYVTYD